MSRYRAYHVDEHGHFHGVPHIFSAETDEDAIPQAKQVVDGYDVELWEEDGYDVELWEEGSRLVTKLKRRD